MNEKKVGLASHIRQSVVTTLVLLLICGFAFPLLLSGISSVLLPRQTGGSLVMAEGRAIGAHFVGQDFTSNHFMKCRPSAYHYNTYYVGADGAEYYTDGSPFAGLSSGSNNFAPTNPALVERVQADILDFLAANPDIAQQDIPTDMLTASGSGLDPHISPASAQVQIPALAAASQLTVEQLQQIVADNTTGKTLGVFGEETVNVLGVNVAIAKAMGLIAQ